MNASIDKGRTNIVTAPRTNSLLPPSLVTRLSSLFAFSFVCVCVDAMWVQGEATV